VIRTKNLPIGPNTLCLKDFFPVLAFSLFFAAGFFTTAFSLYSYLAIKKEPNWLVSSSIACVGGKWQIANR
jgi:hypothetical protein